MSAVRPCPVGLVGSQGVRLAAGRTRPSGGNLKPGEHLVKVRLSHRRRPGVRAITMGRPCRSPSDCVLAIRPARDRPIA